MRAFVNSLSHAATCMNSSLKLSWYDIDDSALLQNLSPQLALSDLSSNMASYDVRDLPYVQYVGNRLTTMFRYVSRIRSREVRFHQSG